MMYDYNFTDADDIDLTKLDFDLKIRDLDREVTITIRANDDEVFKRLADGMQFIMQELKDEIAQTKTP